MEIRRAEGRDVPRIIELLGQVLEIHAAIRPDIFVPGTTKYSAEELENMIRDDRNPVFVAVDGEDKVIGYAFCRIKEQPAAEYMVKFKSIFIDDLCVDAKARRQGVGELLFEFVKREAKRLGCYEVTLNVWAGNELAERFYEKMGMKTKERQMELVL
ncbi:MAG: GNAT family N-acetyltransferase [Clostridia bacterium]|nr:GNAT family N-acetyltransferase [Clostridia bacterium]